MAPLIDLTLYLFQRLRQLGIKSVHGVPGDYNLSALDYLSQADLKWVGNCNELNAGKFYPNPPFMPQDCGIKPFFQAMLQMDTLESMESRRW